MTPVVQDISTLSNQELSIQLYDMLMRDIEPDLLSYNIPKLEEYYKGETEEQNKDRMARYKRAYEDFEYVFTTFMNDVQEEVRETKRESLHEQEMEDRSTEQNKIASLEAAFE